MRSLRLAALVAALSAAFAATCALSACSSTPTATPPDGDSGVAADTSTSSCPADLPKDCPSPAPSWSTQVQPILASRCGSCHVDGGAETADIDLSTYASVYSGRSTVLNQIYGCRMPPVDQPQLTESERVTLLGWFVCDAPNN